MNSLLWEAGAMITEEYPGIYYVEGNTLFPTQIVVYSELDPKLIRKGNCIIIISCIVQRKGNRSFFSLLPGWGPFQRSYLILRLWAIS